MMSNLRKRTNISPPKTSESDCKKRRLENTNKNDKNTIKDDDNSPSKPFSDGQEILVKENSEPSSPFSFDEEEEELEDVEDESEEELDDSDEDYENSFNIDEELEKLKQTDPEAHKTLEDIKQEISRTEPNIQDILKTPMRLEDRAKLCQFYEIYKTQMPNTNEWLEARNQYNELFKEYKAGYQQSKQYSEEQIKNMNEEEKLYTTFNAQLALKYKILNLEATKENKEIIYRRFEEMINLNPSMDEYGKIKHWLKWVTDIPHNKIKILDVDDHTAFIQKAKQKLDSELFGMEKVKEQILLFLSAKIRNPTMVHSNLGLVGPPGTGKTAIARLIAEIMELGFAQISFGGSDKADFLKGHEYTYVGAQPGEIIKSLKRIGHKNGVIFLDELDKIADNPDIRAALLHLIDPTQNVEFRDLFCEIATDLSQIWWVGSMNSIPADEALADRWWIIEVDGYEQTDKVQIIENFLLPRALKNCGMEEDSVTFDTGSINFLIHKVCKSNDKGVRTIQKVVKDLVNKLSFIVSHQDENGELPFKTSFELGKKLTYPIKLTSELLNKLLINKDLNNIMSLSMMYI